MVDDVVIVYTGALVAYYRPTGEPRWFGQANGQSYSSPHLLTIDGFAQIVQLSGAGVTSVAPADGARLWERPESNVCVEAPWRGRHRRDAPKALFTAIA